MTTKFNLLFWKIFDLQVRDFPAVFKLGLGSVELGKLTRKMLKLGK